MPSWNGSFADVDWSSVDFLNMFGEAIWERQRALNAAGAPGGSYSYSPYTVGQDVQVASVISGLQATLASVVTGYMKSSLDGLNKSTAVPFWSGLAEVLTACGSSETSWTRKRPREITSTTATADTQTNAVATGQVAILTTSGNLYRYNGSTWVQVGWDAFAPDLLSSADAAPTKVSSPGVLQAGDYIGPWIFTQLRDVANKIGIRTWTTSVLKGSLLAQGHGNNNTGTGGAPVLYSNVGDAYSAASGLYPGASDTSGFTFPLAWVRTVSSDSGVSHFFAEIEAKKYALSASTPAHRARDFKFLFAPQKPNSGGGHDDTLSTQGSTFPGSAPTAYDVYYVHETVAVASGAGNEVANTSAGGGAKPETYSSPPSPHYDLYTGYVITFFRGEIEWHFLYDATT